MNILRKSNLPRFTAVLASLLASCATAYQSQAQGYVATASLTDHNNGDGTYTYNITLNNAASSLSPIGTFWFAWVPDAYGYDLLPSNPSSVSSPNGWSGSAIMGYGSYYYPDGYSIEWNAGTPLQPGSSATFGFTTTDSPATLESTSPYDNLLASTSYIYSSYAFSDPGGQLAVPLVVPEPTTLSLLFAGAACMSFILRRRKS